MLAAGAERGLEVSPCCARTEITLSTALAPVRSRRVASPSSTKEDDARLPGLARRVLQMLATQIEQIEAAIMALEKHHQTNPLAFLVLIVHGAFWPSQVVNQKQNDELGSWRNLRP